MEISKRKQIEEMAEIITPADPYVICKGQSCLTCEFQDISKNCYTAKALYNAGYRKQSEGEWMSDKETPRLIYKCSVCGDTIGYGMMLDANYCPNCGAKMKGKDGEGE